MDAAHTTPKPLVRQFILTTVYRKSISFPLGERAMEGRVSGLSGELSGDRQKDVRG